MELLPEQIQALTEAVENGAAFLNVVLPGWAGLIDPARLNTIFEKSDVLGLLLEHDLSSEYFELAAGQGWNVLRNQLWAACAEPRPDLGEFTLGLGLNLPAEWYLCQAGDAEQDRYAAALYAELDAAWRRAVQARRTDGSNGAAGAAGAAENGTELGGGGDPAQSGGTDSGGDLGYTPTLPGF